jgi:hypothetical protein
MITVSYIEFGEELGVADSIQQFADEGKGIVILSGDLIQSSLVNT